MCTAVFDRFSQTAESLAGTYGFELVKKSEQVADFTYCGVIRCPRCGSTFEVYDEYTGWHVNSSWHKKI